jgi:membrane-associated phospholipid phosphatase
LDGCNLTAYILLMEQVFYFDRHVLRLINYNWHNNFFDWLMPWLRNSLVWAPLYLFMIVFAVTNFKKNGWWWVLFALCTVTISDLVSSRLIKEHIIRLRPCNDPALADWLRVLVGYRPQSSSFTSSHAANHFALAAFVYTTLKLQFKKWPAAFFFWAFSICYAQVYVGVHYPLDVTAGAVIGILIGYLPGKFFNRNYGLT